MSPEIIKGIYISNACDLWAIGVIIYKFFAEFSPFIGSFEQEILDKIVEENPIFPEGFPEAAKDLCTLLLTKDPLKRLGAGKSGSENDIFALKSHYFFEGIDFNNLHTKESPIPRPMKRKSSLKERIIKKYKKDAASKVKLDKSK
jgi:serine/threonine protein kinase